MSDADDQDNPKTEDDAYLNQYFSNGEGTK